MKKRNFFTIVLASLLVFQSFAFAQTADALLELRTSSVQARLGEEFMVDILLKNPGLQSIVSVRSWLEYNPAFLEAVRIDTEESPFALSAPGETDISAEEGFVKLGRSNVSGGFAQVEGKVATVIFKVKTPYAATAVIQPYDFQTSELGHTSVNIVDQAFPVNILAKAPDALVIQLNPGAAPYMNQEPFTQPTPPTGGVPLPTFANLQRPQNLRIHTGPGYVDLKWDMGMEPPLTGYNLYYGKSSGMYTRRRTVGRVNQYRLDQLNNNEVYYFSVTAYDNQSRESDYSDEVAIIVGEPLSSTSPFEALLASLFAKIPQQPQNGPLVGWLAFSAFGLGGTLAFRKKQNS